ncbi:uncharacterized protein LOC123689456 [Pieris rapae]|uniref:uncharacterized protein LOC123689456 n=1 Tax=Pieris rapae TaxID=64459 RepID=UPI001E27AA38|nr:uncharacterized protein LOC123689456 [Pieris rapae]
MCALLVEHNLPFRVMDHMSEIISKCFTNPEVAKNFSCKRTKAAAVTYNVLKPELEREMQADLRSCQNVSTRAPVYSLIIDESTDVSSTKMLAIVTKYYSEKSTALKTKFLTMVDLEGESAQDLFDALSKALRDLNLDIKDAVGFGADTTNVMFGEHGGIIAKIKNVNPHCLFIKCVCHSTALSVSHASKDTLPRAVNQVVKEVYGYFAHSSKRQREFFEFQEFVNTDKHKILQHYDIRWLSFHSCVNRILEQWDALKLYFQGQYLDDKNISSQFLYESFNNKIYKLYFYALDYILPFVNKLNTVFQGDYVTVHLVYKDVSEMFMALLSCYMKVSYVKSTDPHLLDPTSSVNYLPLKCMYLGVNVSREITGLARDINLKPAIQSFLEHMQSFLIQLSSQLKTRLPLNTLFKQLQFLTPQDVVYKEFSSIANVVTQFPNLVDEHTIQKIDDEYRQLKLDKDVSDLLESGGSNANPILSVDKFWGAVGKIRNSNGNLKYVYVSNFVKGLLCLPMSNAACERIFSKINLLKTKTRNRFTNKHVASILHVKQGISEHGDCVSFQPTKEMIKQMTKAMYKESDQEEYDANTNTNI